MLPSLSVVDCRLAGTAPGPTRVTDCSEPGHLMDAV